MVFAELAGDAGAVLAQAAGKDATFYLQITLTGLAIGATFALSGMGVVLTYKATGIFNFAHGAIGVFVAYCLWQMNQDWGIPAGIAAPVAIFVIGPGIGLGLERFVFRPLARRGATTTEKLVATLGVFVLFLGVTVAIWSGESRTGTSIFPLRGVDLPGNLRLGYGDLGVMGSVALISVALWALFRFTHLGTEIRAVVDRPDLAELASINANRVAGISWALGTGLAGLAGVLFGAGQLDPFRLTLLMLETFAVAVVARLTSLPIAVGAGVLLLGVGRELSEQIADLIDASGTVGESLALIKPNFSTLVLFAALLIYKRLDTVGEAAERITRLAGRVSIERWRSTAVGGAMAFGMLVLPAFLDANGFAAAQRFLAFVVIFASIVAVTGFSGQITLGQAGFAGLGAFAAARMANQLDVPELIAMLFGGAVAMVGGLIAGWPALRRRGLFLALTTLAFGIFVFRFVLDNDAFAGDVIGLSVERPSLLWWTLDGPQAFYYYELAWVGLMLLLVRNLRSGRLGRALAAMRDSEAGAKSVGIDLRNYKLFIFAASAFVAGIGGTLLTQQAEVFEAQALFFPLESLFWFAVVVVAGVTSITGAVVGAFVFVMLDEVVEIAGISQLAIGAGALLLGRLPGGSLVGMMRVGFDRMVESGRRSMAAARREPTAVEPVDDEDGIAWQPSEFARRVVADPVAPEREAVR